MILSSFFVSKILEFKIYINFLNINVCQGIKQVYLKNDFHFKEQMNVREE